jgi:sortase B
VETSPLGGMRGGLSMEVPGREKLNVALAFVPVDIKQISTTIFEAYIVNDSNYYISYLYASPSAGGMKLRSQGIIEPNTKLFIDRVTILYGHNMLNGSMFAELHKFSDEEFFNNNEYIYIYTKGHILTYRIFFAGEYDDRHIINSFDFSDDKVYETYLHDALNPRFANTLVRDGVELTKDDKILILSTCTDYNSSLRFLVQGVLIDDQQTK